MGGGYVCVCVCVCMWVCVYVGVCVGVGGVCLWCVWCVCMCVCWCMRCVCVHVCVCRSSDYDIIVCILLCRFSVAAHNGFAVGDSTSQIKLLVGK